MDKSWAADCTLKVGKIYQQNPNRKQTFCSLSGWIAHGEMWSKNDKHIHWPDLNSQYMFVGRNIDISTSNRLYDRLDYLFLGGKDLFVFSLWDDSVERFERIWEEVG